MLQQSQNNFPVEAEGKNCMQAYTTKLFYMRHGASNSNIIDRRNHAHVGLNRRGRREVKAQKEFVRSLEIERVFSSPILRAHQTAKLLFPESQIEIVTEFSECTGEIWNDLESARNTNKAYAY